MTLARLLAIALFSSLFAVSGALAALPDLASLKASYRVTVNGIPAGTAATVSILSLGGTRHEANFQVENRFFRHREWSRFDWHSCAVTAREYRHEFAGLGIERQSALTFDWERKIAIESRGERMRELPLTPDIIDALNMAMLARCRLRDGDRRLFFPIIYRGERKELRFEVTGRERVETPVGAFDTIVVERRYPQRFRRTRVWVAPALDWFMVRFEHVENPAARGSMLLTGYQLEPPATAATTPAAR